MTSYYKKRRLIYESNTQDMDVPESNISVTGNLSARKSNDSVDDQIDSLILLYEKNSIKEETVSINESLRNLNLKALLFEQEEEASALDEPAGDEPVDDTGNDAGNEPPEPEGSEKVTAAAATEVNVPNLDIDEFVNNIARLIHNKDSLLDIQKVIINRAKNLLNDNYGDAYVQRFLSTLEEQFGLGYEEHNVKYTNHDAPFAIGANPAGAGGMGGS